MQVEEQSKPAESGDRTAERPNSSPDREPARQRAKPAEQTATPVVAATPRTRTAATDDSAARWFVRGSRGPGREQSHPATAELFGLPCGVTTSRPTLRARRR